MIKVGFVFGFQNNNWLGGINYFKNLFQAIYSLPNRRIEPVIFAGFKTNKKFLDGFPPFEIVQNKLLDRYHPKWIERKLIKVATGNDKRFEQLLLKHNIKVLSHHESLGRDSKIPSIGWIPDFQHRHLPEFFSEKEINQRNVFHQKLCADCTKIIVSSHDAESDILLFNPEVLDKVKVLQFAVDVDRNLATASLSDLEKKYGFTGPYFHLPNQFWAHKNHIVVIHALQILKKRGENMTVLVTGNTLDTRQPQHINNLINAINESDVKQNFKILGLVPNSDLFALMKNSKALINPSLFEGWSTTVEEAKSIGKEIILSDIAVHKEQDPRGGVFFNKSNPEDLAKAMQLTQSSVENIDLIRNAEKEYRININMFGNSYQNIVLDMVGR